MTLSKDRKTELIGSYRTHEADTGSERPSYFARTKGVLYADAFDRGELMVGVRAWGVAVVVPSVARVRAIVAACGAWEAVCALPFG